MAKLAILAATAANSKPAFAYQPLPRIAFGYAAKELGLPRPSQTLLGGSER
jgi:hypothetical protein